MSEDFNKLKIACLATQLQFSGCVRRFSHAEVRDCARMVILEMEKMYKEESELAAKDQYEANPDEREAEPARAQGRAL
jgi:hypothetical protein